MRTAVIAELADRLSSGSGRSKENATIFAAGSANHISTGALLLVSDQSMVPEGVRTEASDQVVTANYVERHIKIGMEALKLVRLPWPQRQAFAFRR